MGNAELLFPEDCAAPACGAAHRPYSVTFIAQWQGGQPVPVYPPAIATAKPVWTGK